MPTSSTLTLDTDRVKLMRNYWESVVTEDEHYTYDYSERVYINLSNLGTGHAHGYNTTKGIVHKALLKNLLKSEYLGGTFDATKWRQLNSELTANLTHD